MSQASTFKRYYEDELAFLRELGGEFSHSYPDIARELGLQGHDPDVERLLQGVAFLTGRIRQSLAAQFPDLLYPLLSHVWPQALRPTPCTAMIEFLPRPNMFREPFHLARGAELRAEPIDGTSCTFRTAYDTTILPLQIDDVRLSAPTVNRQRLTVCMKALPGAQLGRLVDETLRLHFHGSSVKGMGREAFGLYASIGHGLRFLKLVAQRADGSVLGERTLLHDALQAVGFSSRETLLPYPVYSPSSYRLLTEFFLQPAKHLFFDVRALHVLADFPTAERLELQLDFDPLPGEPLSPALLKECVRLNCVPAVNLFPHTASPLLVDGKRTEYPLRPEGTAPHHHEIFSVEKVMGHLDRQPNPTEYFPFYSFHRPKSKLGEVPVLYQVIPRAPVAETRSDHEGLSTHPAVPMYLALVMADGRPVVFSDDEKALPTNVSAKQAVVSVDLLCTNRDLPTRLRTGSICRPTSDIPSTLQFRNIGPISEPAPALVTSGGDGLWRLFAHQLMAQNHFRDRDALRMLFQLFDVRAQVNQAARHKLETLLDAVIEVSAQAESRLAGSPKAVTRGTHVELRLHEDRFAFLGELYLLGDVLEQFLAESSQVNTFTALSLHGKDHDLSIHFPARLGHKRLL